MPADEGRVVVLEPVRDVRGAAAQKFTAKHRQRAIDVAFARDREAFVCEPRDGQIGPLAVVARQLGPAADRDRVEVLRLDEALEREVEARRPLVVDALGEGPGHI